MERSDGVTVDMNRRLSLTAVCFFSITFIALGGAQEDFEATRTAYEHSSHDEQARLTYVTKLAEIASPLVTEYRQSGHRNDELMGEINSELQKHPAPKDSDSEKLKQLLIGKWESPRRIYVFLADGKWGNEDGPVSDNWRISGNDQLKVAAAGQLFC